MIWWDGCGKSILSAGMMALLCWSMARKRFTMPASPLCAAIQTVQKPPTASKPSPPNSPNWKGKTNEYLFGFYNLPAHIPLRKVHVK